MIGNKQILADTSALAQSNKYNSINYTWWYLYWPAHEIKIQIEPYSIIMYHHVQELEENLWQVVAKQFFLSKLLWFRKTKINSKFDDHDDPKL